MDIIVIDSVAALTPQAEIEGDMGDAHVGLQARLMSQALRKLTGTLSKSKTILVFINQIRMKIGVMFGNPETTTGGNALKFYASVRLEVRKIETIKKGEEEAVGNRSASRSSRTRSPLPSARSSSSSCSGRAFPGRARSSTRPSSTRSSTRRAPGTPGAKKKWGRAGTTPGSTSSRTSMPRPASRSACAA